MDQKHQRWWDFPAAILFFLALLTSTWRLAATHWTSGLEAVTALAILGALLGMALGYSRLRGLVVSLLALGYTSCLVPWVLGSTQYNNGAWRERIAGLGRRLAESINLFLGHNPVEDVLLFIASLSLFYWLVGLIGGYMLTRRAGFLAATLPAGIALLVIHFFDNGGQGNIAYLFVYLFAGLLLLGRLNYIRQRSNWKAQNIYLPSETGYNLNITILFTTIVIIALVWLMPTPSQAVGFARKAWRQISQTWRSESEDLGNIIAGLDEGGAAGAYYGDTLSMGREAIRGDSVLFSVQLPPADRVPRYYWRVRVYDFYSDGVWDAPPAASQEFSPEQPPLAVLYTAGKETSSYTFSIKSSVSVLFTPARPVWVSHTARLSLERIPGGEVDPLLFQTAALRAGEEYQVEAVDISPTEQELRAAGTDYPTWVTEQYLQLPGDLSPRIQTLALELTQDAATPYDKAAVITNYLRREISYTPEIPPPPAGRDVLEWFLFDYKQGFCNYYASAEVILLRAVGVPARLAVGYAEGEILPGTFRVRRVRRENAHAWPEVFFPNIGWVEFEPTAGQLPLNRPAGEALNNGLSATQAAVLATKAPPEMEPPEEGSAASPETPRKLASWQIALITGILIAAGLGGYILWKRYKRHVTRPPLPVRLKAAVEKAGLSPPRWLQNWARWTSLTPIERSFAEIYRSLRRLGSETPTSQTPAEAATALTVCLPEAGAEIASLLEAYLPAVYGRTSSEAAPARQTAESIRRKSRRTIWRNRLSRLRRAFIIGA